MRRINFSHLIVCAVLLLLSACGQDAKTNRQNDLNDLSKYIIEHSPERISVRDEIALRFREEYRGIDLSQSVRLSPKVNGAWAWSEDGLLVFDPSEPLPYDQQYEVFISLPDIAEPIQWHFSTMPLRYELSTDGVSIDRAGEVSLSGVIRTNDYVDPETVEKGLAISQQGGSDVSVSWEHDPSGRRHAFVLTDIDRYDEKESELEVAFSGAPHDDYSYDQSFVVFPKNSFQFVSADLSESPERRVRLQFSTPVARGQNLKGLITIDQQDKSPKTMVDGNVVYVYPTSSIDGAFKLYISDKLKNIDGKSLGRESLIDLRFDMADPEIRVLGSGTIIPSASSAVFAIETMNLKAVDVEVVKIFSDNVLQHLQNYRISEGYSLDYVGRIVWRGRVDIADAETSTNEWMRVGIDLSDYLSMDQGALYQIRVGYQRAYAHTDCESDVDAVVADLDDPSMMRYPDDFYYHYDERDDACSPYYYHPDRFVRRNVLLSDVGVITTRGRDGSYTFAVSDIPSGRPLGSATVGLYDMQQQLLIEAQTSGDGLLTTRTEREAAFAIVSHPSGYAYIRYQDNEANSLSEYNVAGVDKSTPIDGYIYADRGVHRPGDTVHLYFMLEDVESELPARHPVTLTVKDPKGTLQSKRTTSQHVDKVYVWTVPTAASGATGTWRAAISVGQKTFYKNLRIEAVKPNRLKIQLDHPDVVQYSDGVDIGLDADWLYGAPGAGLDAHVEATLANRSTTFDGFDEYTFVDPAREGVAGLQTWYKGKLNAQGQADVPIKFDPKAFPGKVEASIKTRVFEPSGNFSVDYGSLEISPFDGYVGVTVPKNRWGYSSVKLGEDAQYEIVALSPDGQPLANRELAVGFYDVRWEWWYYRSNNRNLYRLNSAEHKEAFYTTKVKTDSRGRAIVTSNLAGSERGRKMIRVCDPVSGHCSGEFFYASTYGSSDTEDNREFTAQLTLSSDKTSYQVGDRAKISIPSEAGTRLLISIENGSKVIYQEWVEGRAGQTDYEIELSAEMVPNVYAYVTMLQAYDTKQNDLPIRMYGVLPISVDDPATELEPVVDVAETLEPDTPFEVRVSESDGQPMTYTIAIVDEGLLDLTRYKTPAPHDHFYAHQSLGVNTWDIYNDVLTGVNGEVDQMISIGGDGTGDGEDGSKKATRFKPVVMTAGPFSLARGQKATHQFSMPNYMGSVRTMIVAREDDSYGHAEATSAVKSPVMVLSTMPRVLSPGEEVSIPVSVFATERGIKNVTVSIDAGDHLELLGAADQTVSFDDVGDQLVHFRARVKENLGIANIKVNAKGGRHTASESIEIDVRNPNPYTSTSMNKLLKPGESYSYTVEPHGVTGTNEAVIELGTFPSIDLGSRLDMLMRYPYGCVEQTTSAALPQVYLADIMDLSDDQRDRTISNVSYAITRLSRMQLANGGFSYWPGGRSASDWGTSYAGQFLIAAKKNGFAVRSDILSRWTDYQSKQARSFKIKTNESKYSRERALIAQAYRLYTLALAGSPEMSAMNVLKLNDQLPQLARFLLSGAYAVSGKKSTAIEIIQGAPTDVKDYTELGYTYGSGLRDRALIGQVLMLTDRSDEGARMMRDIAQSLNSGRWYSTQTVGQSLAAVGGYLREQKSGNIRSEISIGSDPVQSISSDRPLYSYTYDPDDHTGQQATIKNAGNVDLYVQVASRGQRPTSTITTTTAVNKNISLSVQYTDMNGKEIDISDLTRGTDFMAVCTVRNLNTRGPRLDEMALTQVIPAGWEIQSGGLSNVSGAITESGYDYRDVRDDRVSTFFDLSDRATYRIMLTAAYDGEYYLPPVVCEAMYDDGVISTTAGQVVRVTEP